MKAANQTIRRSQAHSVDLRRKQSKIARYFTRIFGKGHGLTLWYQALFLSPKNNIEGALAVLKAANCHLWVKPSEKQLLPLIEGVLQQRPMKVLQLPSLDELLDAESTDPFPFNKTFEGAGQEPFCMLHTSGTTGVPKPIWWSHALVGTMDAVRLLPPTKGDGGLKPWTSDWCKGDTIYSSFPMSHVSA